MASNGITYKEGGEGQSIQVQHNCVLRAYSCVQGRGSVGYAVKVVFLRIMVFWSSEVLRDRSRLPAGVPLYRS